MLGVCNYGIKDYETIYISLIFLRRRLEAGAGSERKPRLIEESELPPFLLQDDDELDELEAQEKAEKESDLVRGNRARKETNYDDQLSEKDWLKAIGAEEEEFEDDEDDTPKKRGNSQR